MAPPNLFNKEKLHEDFNSILDIRENIFQHKIQLEEKINNLKEIYNMLVKQNTKKILLFCLDSFYFQYKTLIIEMDNIQRYILMLNNRMYGDYYKFYHLILTQTCDTHIIMKESLDDFKKYEHYRDLEPFHEYKQGAIAELHNDVLQTMNHMYLQFLAKEQVTIHYEETTSRGLSIGNFIQTLHYENALFREQVILYTNYLSFFHTSHIRYLEKLEARIKVFLYEIEENILHQTREIKSIEPSIEVMQVSHNSDISASADGCLTEVKKIEEPVAVKVEEPVAVKVEEPVAIKIEEPVTVKIEEPATIKVEEPVAIKIEEPVAVKVEEPVAVKVEEPVAVKVEEPVAVKVEEPVAVKVEEPVAIKIEEHVAVKVEEPVAVKVEEPVAVKVEEPVAVKVEEPVAVKVEEPVAVKVEEPVAVKRRRAH